MFVRVEAAVEVVVHLFFFLAEDPRSRVSVSGLPAGLRHDVRLYFNTENKAMIRAVLLNHECSVLFLLCDNVPSPDTRISGHLELLVRNPGPILIRLFCNRYN